MPIKLYYQPELDTLDLWLDEPSQESYAQPLGDNITIKIAKNGAIIGAEIISLSKLTEEDLKAMPPNIRKALKTTLQKIAKKALEIKPKT